MEKYTMQEFKNACMTVLSDDAYENALKCEKSSSFNVSDWCELVAREQLLCSLECSEERVLRVIRVTAYNLWKNTGCHELL
jgi:hypothetical protein